MQSYAILMLACIYEIVRFEKVCDVCIAGMTNPQVLVILWTTGPWKMKILMELPTKHVR